jgi:uncharacterized protein
MLETAARMLSIAVAGLALLIGVSLGMLGGGGSILTVPMLIYVAGMSPPSAIASSLIVVGVTSAIAATAHARAGRVQWRTGVLFGLAGMIGAFVGGRASALVPPRVLMVLFALMMVATGTAMLRGRRVCAERRDAPRTGGVLALGVGVGFVTGLVGAGGGFIVVPALVLLAGLPMTIAAATSLVVITMNTFAGLIGHLGQVDVDVRTTAVITILAIAGSVAGTALAGRVDPFRLRQGFGVLVLATAVVILAAELGLVQA